MPSSNNSDLAIKARKALWLFVPAPSLGVAMSTYLYPGIIGQFFFTLIKIWLVLLPVFWRLRIDKKGINIPKINSKQIKFGLIVGLLMSAVIIITYWLIGQNFLDVVEVKNQAITAGITKVGIYFLGVVYWSFINSLIEEFVWRGFVYGQCRFLQTQLEAIITSALFFTLHHIIALFFYLQNPILALVCSCGVFLAGVLWSVCYEKVGLWACYVSHILADLAIAYVGWHLLFA